MPDWIGKTIGKVRIEKYLARGGMAEVYLGTHLTLDRAVAVKVMHSHVENDPDLQARFQREARVVAGLRHSNIVQVYDFDTAEGHPYIVMEYLAGPPLAVYLRDIHQRGARLPFLRVSHWLESLASAIDYAHKQGVIHRDVKPANILLQSDSGPIELNVAIADDVEPILTDFGLVRILHSTTQTTSGVISGTPAYMSPEQASGAKVDSRTDVYSLGVVLYEMLAGRVPFEADSTMAVLRMHMNEPPPPISGIPPALQAIINQALAKNPDNRYQTCKEMAADFLTAVGLPSLARAHQSRSPKKPIEGLARIRLWIGISAVLVLLFLAGIFLPRFLSQPAPSTTDAPTSAQSPTSDIVTFPPAADGTPVGDLKFQDDTKNILDQAVLTAQLIQPPPGKQYEAWLIGNAGGARHSMGVLSLDGTGKTQLTFTDPQNRNLLGLFDHFEITLEPSPDNNPNSSGNVIYSSAIPPRALVSIRNLLVSMNNTPQQVGLISGLYDNVDLIDTTAKAMLAAHQKADDSKARLNAEAIVNLIVGSQDTKVYGDLNGDGVVTDPGDGYGLLLNGDQLGYISAIVREATSAAAATDASADIKTYAAQLSVITKNLEEWAPQLRDLCVTIGQSSPGSDLNDPINQVVAISDKLLNGIDLDSDGRVDPVTGEGGVITAYDQAYLMPTMPILPGEGQIPAPGP